VVNEPLNESALGRESRKVNQMIGDVQQMLEWMSHGAEPAEEIEGAAIRAGVARPMAHREVGWLIGERGQLAHNLKYAMEALRAEKSHLSRLMDAARDAPRP
jgi:hypothetical protein